MALARRHFHAASNLTDRLAALAVLVNAHDREADAALEAYAKRHAGDALVLDKWFALQATLAEAHTLARVEALTAHAAFRWTNPNNVYALLGAFALRNPRAFHRRDGAGYRFIAQAICRLDAVTPQVAARLATAEEHFVLGDSTQAKIFAMRARELLERNSPEWRRATDIVLVSKPTPDDLKELAREQPREPRS